MALETDFNISPYFDDYNETKDFYKILFRPGVSVQARELNQFQTILQKQIERFGDNIFKRGTIIDGCNFIFYPSYQYVKILDTQKDGLTAIPADYVGYFAKSSQASNGVNAFIINYQDGFESTDPDLKTLYLNYINSGANGSVNTFSGNGEVITIYDPAYPIFKVKVTNGGVGFSNSDQIVVSPALVVNVSTGTFTNGELLYQAFTNADVQIIGIDNATLASSNQVILRVKPLANNLTSSSANSSKWTIANAQTIRNTSNTVIGTVEGIVGSSFDGTLTTDSSGRVIDVTIVNRGSGYSTLPYITAKSANNSSLSSGTFVLEAQNYLANVQIASVANSVGNGYAFGVTEGVIYQKGFFSRVSPQTVIVEKYSSSPDELAVGFDTQESIIDSNIDTSLLDNATGTENENAPGANRFKLTPELVVKTSADASSNDNFFTLVEWSEGRPYKQNQQTAYNKINDELARRTADESGDYVINQFLVTTTSPSNSALEGNTYSVVVDPGIAYIAGHRIETKTNYTIDVSKGIDFAVTNNQSISLDYGNYVRIKEVGGLFQYSTGDFVKLYDSAKQFITNTAAASIGNTDPVGTQIGTAYIRSMLHFDGIPGTANAVYKLYLFNVNMNPGKNFRDVKSVYYDGTNKGIADIQLTLDGTLNQNIAMIEGVGKETLLFDAGVYSLKSTSNTYYSYRTIDQSLSVSNTGLITKDISGSSGEYYPYTGTISDSDAKKIYLVPTSNAMLAFESAAGNVSVNTTSANVIGTDTTFASDFQVGDYVYLSPNATANAVKRIVSIVNSTIMVLDSNVSFANTTDTKVYRYFPKNVPIQLGSRNVASQNNHNANVSANGKVLTVKFKHANGADMSFVGGTTTANVSLGVDIERRDVTPLTKNATRKVFVKYNLANAQGNTVGPWCLGVPDAFRLRSVYIGNSSVNTSFTDVVDDFYIDHNQNENFYDLSYLYKIPGSSLSLTSSDYLLVEFDYGTSTGAGFLNTLSYTQDSNVSVVTTNDSLPLSNLTTTYNTLEVPEVFTKQGKYYDLLGTFDFRPRAANTVAPNTDFASAPLNPTYTLSFGNTADPTNDKKFPLPQSLLKTNIEYYLYRTDSIFADRDGDIFVVKGTPVTEMGKAKTPDKPAYALRLNDLAVMPYPNIPVIPSNNYLEIINRNIANENISNRRLNSRFVKTLMSGADISRGQPIGYTMEDIGNLDRRIKDLEYYVSLSLLESNMKDRVIPSSLDPTLSRFKYGFFIDDFSTLNYSEIDHKAYSATVEQDDVMPAKEGITLTNPVTSINQQYIEYAVVSQKNATGIFAGNNVITVANTWAVRKEPSKKKDDVFNLTLSSISAPVTLYGHFYSGADSIKIYQGNTLIRQSNTTFLENLTDSDKTKLKSNVVPGKWFSDVKFSNLVATSVSGDPSVKYSFKITWNHNPSNGQDYTIKVKNHSVVWRYAIEYPINSSKVSNVASNTAGPVVYTGYANVTPKKVDTRWNSKDKKSEKYGSSYWNGLLFNDGNYAFTMNCTGLKPNTKHEFFYKNVNKTSDCKSLMDTSDVGTSTLISDSAGNLNFKFYKALNVTSGPQFGATGDNDSNNFSPVKSTNYYINEPVGNALLEVRAENSSAKATVEFKDF